MRLEGRASGATTPRYPCFWGVLLLHVHIPFENNACIWSDFSLHFSLPRFSVAPFQGGVGSVPSLVVSVAGMDGPLIHERSRLVR